MNRVFAFLLICVTLPATAAEPPALDGEIAALRAEIDALSARLAALERRPAAAVSATPAVQPAAPGAPAVAAVDDGSLDWARRLKWKADLRYRHEVIDEQGLVQRDRQRIRARIGLEGQVSDEVGVTLQVASGGDDPRSTNQTLGDGFTTKPLGIDLAFFDWQPIAGLDVYGGKMKYPFYRADQNLFFDPDLNPEGLAVAYRNGIWFGSVFGFWVDERGSASDSTLLGGQFGIRTALANGLTLTSGVGFFDYGAVQGGAPFFEADPAGNSVDANGNLLFDYDLVEVFGELGFAARGLPMSLYGGYVQNTAADDLDTGIVFGLMASPGPWKFGYQYMDMEKDAVFAQAFESDFADGTTDSRGHVLRAVYAFGKRLTANLSYFVNERDVDVGNRRDYNRLQLDVSFKL